MNFERPESIVLMKEVTLPIGVGWIANGQENYP